MTCDIALTIAIPEPARMWEAARGLLQRAGLDRDTIIETIGESGDPQIEDCIAVLLVPDRIAGCELVSIGVRRRDAVS